MTSREPLTSRALLVMALAWAGCSGTAGDDDDDSIAGADAGGHDDAAVDGGTDDGDAGAEGIAFEDLPAHLAAAVCAGYEECGDLASEGAHWFFCDEELTTRFRENLLRLYRWAIEAGTLVYDPQAMVECLADFDAKDCGERGGFPVCEDALEGLIAVGGDCSETIECAGNAYCLGLQCPGTCTAPSPRGAPCGATYECDSRLACTDGHCAPMRERGERCDPEQYDPGCDPALSCVRLRDGGNATCQSSGDIMQGRRGEACGWDVACQEGLYCAQLSELDGECEPLAVSRGPCRCGWPDPCPQGERCAWSGEQGAREGTCIPLPVEGEACDDDQCAERLVCIGKICRHTGFVGEACDNLIDCLTVWCDAGVCIERPYCP